MLSLARSRYALPTEPTVRWLATQERNLNRELPCPDPATESPEEYVSRTYLQFLWLPQSIMPLQFLIPALLRVTPTQTPASPSSTTKTSRPASQSSQSPVPAAHPLHTLLQPVLLSSRAASQKYHSRITHILAEENEPADPEEEYLWYAYQKDKVGEDTQDVNEQEDDDEAQERLKSAWLEKFERREVQIQILLYFLLITLPGGRAPEDAQTAGSLPFPLPPPLTPSKSKKRKRKEERGKGDTLPQLPPLEERLESYMDKLVMWQLMHAVDSSLHRGAAGRRNGNDKGKEKDKDDRDWMQAFCEDVVEPLFKAQLPELCALFHAKLFPDDDSSDTDSLGLSPPVSPRPTAKRLKSTASSAGPSKAASSNVTAAANDSGKGKVKNKSHSKDAAATKSSSKDARSRSLSQTLEQEKRERSRSLSIGPNGHLRKRTTMFEVTMTTKFGKARAKEQQQQQQQKVGGAGAAAVQPPGPSLARTQSLQQVSRGEKGVSMGSVLVAATPVKPRTAERTRTQSQSQQARLPALFVGASASASSSRSHSSLHVTAQGDVGGQLGRVDSLNINIDTDEEDEGADTFATPTKARRVPTLLHVPGDGGEDGDENEWRLDSSPGLLLLGAAEGSQEWSTSGDEDPPASSSSPGDLGGFGDDELDGRVLVGETPTKPKRC